MFKVVKIEMTPAEWRALLVLASLGAHHAAELKESKAKVDDAEAVKEITKGLLGDRRPLLNLATEVVVKEPF